MTEKLHSLTLTINGTVTTRQVLPRLSLADFLRTEIGLTGTHVGCEHGVCGACTIRFNGRLTRSCLMFAIQADDAQIETIEGLTESGELKALQDKFEELNAAQCGFCTPGILVTAAQLLQETPNPSRQQIREYLSGNYCRCTGYHAIIDAVEQASKNQKGR